MHGYGVPEIFESEETGVLSLVYADIKKVLKVPIVNFIFRTLALYDQFLTEAWKQVRPNMLTTNSDKMSAQLRYPKLPLQVPTIQWSSYYNRQTLEQIRQIIYVFNAVNPKLLIIVSAWSEALANRPNSGNAPVEGTTEPGIMTHQQKINLIHIPNAPLPVKQVLLDIAQKHHAYDVASDFRALAHYPQFLTVAWSYLKPYVGTDDYNMLTANLKSKAIQLSKHLPYRVDISRDQLESLYSDKEIAGIMGLVSMFQNFIPGLIVDLEYFRKILTIQ